MCIVIIVVVIIDLQLLVQATRQSTVTSQTATASVNIIVLRNENPPIFIGSYFETVDERLRLGSSVVQLVAQDSDTLVSFVLCTFMLFSHTCTSQQNSTTSTDINKSHHIFPCFCVV